MNIRTFHLPRLTVLVTLLVAGGVHVQARADDCNIGDCYLIREAVRERREFLDDYLRHEEERARYLARQEQRERQDEERQNLAAKAAQAANDSAAEPVAAPGKKAGKVHQKPRATATTRKVDVAVDQRPKKAS